MKRLVVGLAVLTAAAAPASAQQASSDLFLPLPSWIRAGEAEEPLTPGAETSLGLRAGFHKARDADEGTWLGGVQLRLGMGEVLALEGSIEVRRDEFLDGVAKILSYPVQATLLVYLMKSEMSLYLLGGLGWYYSKISFDSSLGVDDETDSDVGFHIGAGVDFGLGEDTSVNGDIRYIFLDPDSDNLENEDFDTIEFTIGLNFRM